jgi:N-acetylglutamate synthase-like GNAT family acetyltransferase
MSSTQLKIRAAKERDLKAIAAIFASDGMVMPQAGELIGESANSHALVAVNNDDVPVGIIRILNVADPGNPAGDGAYVYPVIVHPAWQQRKVATALIKAAAEQFGVLKLVACKASQGFYPKVDFVPLDWSEVAFQIARDCDLCPDCPTCNPQPFKRP